MRCAISGHDFDLPSQTKKVCEQLGVPLPVISHRESLRRKLGYRNYIGLYRRTCDLTGRSIISNFAPNSPFRVYDREAWWGDGWDPMEYGRPFDFSRPFFPQLFELQKAVPIFSLQNLKTENAEYCNSVENIRRCYLAFVCYYDSEDVYYAVETFYARDIYFSLYTFKGENNCYCFQTTNCQHNIGVEECTSCSDCTFSFMLHNCSNCLFCSNLRNKEYHIANERCSKAAYAEYLRNLKLETVSGLEAAFARFEELKRAAAWRESIAVNCEDCTGNHMVDCQNSSWMFQGGTAKDSAECMSFTLLHNVARCYGVGAHSDTVYECTGSLGNQFCSFLIFGYYCHNCHYSINIHNCRDCFGCVGLRNKQYCVFNRQYTRDQYETLNARIIAHMQQTTVDDPSFTIRPAEWGQFFPLQFSYYPYNLSLGQIFLPLRKEEALARRYLWEEQGEGTVYAAGPGTAAFPQSIGEWKDEDAKKSFRCSRSGRAFNIILPVIKKFRELNLAILPEHPIEYLTRHLQKVACELTSRTSSYSNTPMLTAYSAQQAPIILTNAEYLREFY
jgi:hypothetical protein